MACLPSSNQIVAARSGSRSRPQRPCRLRGTQHPCHRHALPLLIRCSVQCARAAGYATNRTFGVLVPAPLLELDADPRSKRGI